MKRFFFFLSHGLFIGSIICNLLGYISDEKLLFFVLPAFVLLAISFHQK
jgi:hypothetical protein